MFCCCVVLLGLVWGNAVCGFVVVGCGGGFSIALVWFWEWWGCSLCGLGLSFFSSSMEIMLLGGVIVGSILMGFLLLPVCLFFVLGLCSGELCWEGMRGLGG